MNQYFLLSGIITIIYLVVKQIESRYTNAESKPLKYTVRDGVLVFGSAVATLFLANIVDSPFRQMLAMVTNTSSPIPTDHLNVYTNQPDF
jgi:hypothetical protein